MSRYRDESDYPPSGCRHCGHARYGHWRLYTRAAGWHQYEPPTIEQIKTRMLLRATLRRNPALRLLPPQAAVDNGHPLVEHWGTKDPARRARDGAPWRWYCSPCNTSAGRAGGTEWGDTLHYPCKTQPKDPMP